MTQKDVENVPGARAAALALRAPSAALVPGRTNEAAIARADEVNRARQEEFAPKNTVRAYEFELQCFTSWCTRHGLRALPADERTIAVYLQELADFGRAREDLPRRKTRQGRRSKCAPLKYGSIIRALGAICRGHERANLPSPWKLRRVVETRESLERQLGAHVEKKRALTADVFRRVIDQIPLDTLRGKRDRALLLLGWHGARRRSEVVAARVEDFQRDTDPDGRPGVKWLIPRSKTDQGGRGFKLSIVPMDDARYCAIAALRAWTRASGVRSGPLFRRIDARGAVGARGMCAETVARLVKAYAEAAGLDATEVGGHSLRSGWITTAAKARRTPHEIMRVTGQRSFKTVEEYIQETNVLENAPGRGLL